MTLINNILKYFNFKKFKVLIVDDVISNVELITSYFNIMKKIKTFKSYDPNHAEELLSKYDFDLIILDIQMPKLDGYELALNIKSGLYLKNKNTPIIFITGIYYSDIDKIRGYNMGSIDYLLKPIIYENFLKKIKKYINIGNDDRYFIDVKIDNIKNSINL